MDIRSFFSSAKSANKRKRSAVTATDSQHESQEPKKRPRLIKRGGSTDDSSDEERELVSGLQSVFHDIDHGRTTVKDIEQHFDAKSHTEQETVADVSISHGNSDDDEKESVELKQQIVESEEHLDNNPEFKEMRKRIEQRIEEIRSQGGDTGSKFKFCRDPPRAYACCLSRYKPHFSFDPLSDPECVKDRPLPYVSVSRAFESLSQTTKRLEKIEILAKLFESVLLTRPQELVRVVLLCVNELAPAYEGIELGVGDSIIMKALCQSTGRQMKDVKKEMQNIGDLGEIAVKSRNKQRTMFKPKPLTVEKVFNTLVKVAQTKGAKSQTEKLRLIQLLFVASRECESQFIVRHLQGKLRIGVNEQTVIAALARMCLFVDTPVTRPIDDSAKSMVGGTGHKSSLNHSVDSDLDDCQMNDDKKKQISKDVIKLAATEEEYVRILKRASSEVPDLRKVIDSLIFVSGMNVKLNRVCKLTPGIPIKVMLAKPTKGVSEILAKLSNAKGFTLEFKYDGERAQIHILSDGSVHIFSRNAENNTAKFPEIVENFRHHKYDTTICDDTIANDSNDSAQSSSYLVSDAILDSEVVAYDTHQQRILPFQELTKRKRKDVKAEDISVNVCIYAFDLLYLNGESLLRKSLKERRRLMHEHFKPMNGEFMFADFRDVILNDNDGLEKSLDSEEKKNEVSENDENENDDDDEQDEDEDRDETTLKDNTTEIADDEITENIEQSISEYLDLAVESYCEGLMVKRLDGIGSSYEPSKRSHNWLKCKKDYLDGIGDTLDLCVMGAFYGIGKRTGVFGSYLLGCYNEDSETIQSVCKCATGFKDHDLSSLTRLFQGKKKAEVSSKEESDTVELIAEDEREDDKDDEDEELMDIRKDAMPSEYETGMKCDVWFEPRFVFEIKCADLTLSPIHTGAIGQIHDSKGIGLRFPRFLRLRMDKSPQTCSNADQIVEMYNSQTVIAAAAASANGGAGKRFR